MIAKLAEGETPDIDPAECSSGNQSFSALITRALKEGNIDYQDPSVLLKQMTRSDNAGIREENRTTALIKSENEPATARVIPFPQPETEKPPVPNLFPVIVIENGRERVEQFTADRYNDSLAQGLLDVTLFGAYLITDRRAKQGRA